MSKLLQAPSENFIKTAVGELNSDATAGSDVELTLINNQGFSLNDFIVVGVEGAELSELIQINTTVTAPGTTIQVSGLSFAHKAGTPIRLYKFNQRKFYGATASGGTFVELTVDGSPVTIPVDNPQGTPLEYTGAEGYAYFKATYYNSQTAVETALADSNEVLADESKRYCSLYGIRKAGGFTDNPFLTDGQIETKRKQAENEIDSCLIGWYVLPLAEVPPLIQNICEKLAAGYIDFEEFGPDGNGVKMLGEARGILNSIKKGTQRLIGADGTELARPSRTNVLLGKPDGTETGGEKSKFQTDQIF